MKLLKHLRLIGVVAILLIIGVMASMILEAAETHAVDKLQNEKKDLATCSQYE